MANETNGTAAAGTTTLHFRRFHPGGGVLGRCSYGIPGVPGIIVFDMGMFPDGKAPATLVLNYTMAQPTARKVAGVTSAVVAAANVAVAEKTETAIAEPAAVAATAATAAAAIVAAAAPATAAPAAAPAAADVPRLVKASGKGK